MQKFITWHSYHRLGECNSSVTAIHGQNLIKKIVVREIEMIVILSPGDFEELQLCVCFFFSFSVFIFDSIIGVVAVASVCVSLIVAECGYQCFNWLQEIGSSDKKGKESIFDKRQQNDTTAQKATRVHELLTERRRNEK